ncbi:outer membrane beta-barrel protein [Methylocapsa palsarum]|uniref:outer membrane beta-barrel protein n=1 Tax=Methylocapsa palsarum TaxID=1612308 RepID=UPI001FCCE059|nr:outer membrane beta-barrel protein [Methylocapsa palsarum]
MALQALCAGMALLPGGQAALAADVAATKPPPSWWDTFTIGGAIDAGLLVNPVYPANGLNFGHLFTDKANSLMLNQAMLTVQRPIDPTSKDYDYGFKIQGFYGSDARYTHFLGEGEYWINGRYQLDVVEANAQVHLPWLFSGGIDVKAGQFPTLLGAEVIPAGDNLLYSHSYIFNFGVPLKLTGVAAVAHIVPEIDVYAGFNTGVNTTIAWPGDNNGGVGFEGGIGLNLMGGALTVLATTNIGPQNPATPVGIAGCGGCAPSSTLRFLNDMVVTWKATDKLTFITDMNWIHDDAAGGLDGFGIAQYAAYAINDWLKIVGRAEVWRDNNNFFVSSLGAPGNFNYVNSEHGYLNFGGYPPAGAFAPAPTTYLELTAGLNITAPPIPNVFGLPDAAWIKSVTLRPEIRYDASLNNTTPFDVGTRSSQLTFGGDIVVKF